jgi:hypothetical protein
MSASSLPAPKRQAAYTFFERVPYWLLAVLFLGVIMAWRVVSDDSYATIFAAVAKGIGVTIYVTVVAYAGAIVVGLLGRHGARLEETGWFTKPPPSMSRSSAAFPCSSCCSTSPLCWRRRQSWPSTGSACNCWRWA